MLKMKSVSFVLLFSILLCAGLTVWMPSQVINSDSVARFNAWKGWQLTGEFNVVIEPCPDDVSEYSKYFLSWWSPGQYLAPMFISNISGLTVAYSAALTNFLCMTLGLLGFYFLYRSFGIPDVISIVSLFLIVTSTTFLSRFITFMGGESLSFLTFPWILFFAKKLKVSIIQGFYCFLAVLAGFYAKSQMLIAVPLGLLSLFWTKGEYAFNFKGFRFFIKHNLSVIIGILCAIFSSYIFFLRSGSTPVTAEPVFSRIPEAAVYLRSFLEPLSMPLAVLLNIGDILNSRLFSSHEMLRNIVLVIMAVFVYFSLTLGYRLSKYKYHGYNQMVVVYWVLNAAVFTAIYLSGAAVDSSARHFKFVAYLWFPTLCFQLKECSNLSRRRGMLLSLLLVIILTAYSLWNHQRLIFNWVQGSWITPKGLRLHENVDIPQEIYRVLSEEYSEKITFVISEYGSRWSLDLPLLFNLPFPREGELKGRGPRFIVVEKKGPDRRGSHLKDSFDSFYGLDVKTIGGKNIYILDIKE